MNLVTCEGDVLPYGRHHIDADDIQAVVDVLSGPSLTTGPQVEALERDLAEVTRAPDAVACSSGTAALHLSAMGLNLGPGDAVIVPSVTFVASANAFRLAGCEIVFADVDAETGLLTPDTLDAALQRVPAHLRARAVVAVHLNGQTADMEGLHSVAQANGLWLIADACHALGAGHWGRDAVEAPVGACRWAHLETFSFHPVKAIAMGEGGAVTVSNTELAARLRRLRSHGLTRNPASFTETDQSYSTEGVLNPWYYEMHEPGLNYRASDIQCALGRSQLKKLALFVNRRRTLAARYDEAIQSIAPVVQPPARTARCQPAWHLYACRIDFNGAGLSRAEVMKRLHGHDIGTQVHYIPVHRQPYYRHRYGATHLAGADAYYETCLSLPLFPDMSDEDIHRVMTALKSAMEIA